MESYAWWTEGQKLFAEEVEDFAALSVLCGMFINGSNSGLLAVATISYPPLIRGSGIGRTYAVAKVGAMLAPAVGGFLLSRNWNVGQICSSNALVGLFVAALLLILQGRARRQAAVSAARSDAHVGAAAG